MPVRYVTILLSLFLQYPLTPANSAGLEDADERLFKVQMALAEKGDPRAQYYLGEMHEQGLGTRQDIEAAFTWYVKSAEKGDPLARRKLAHRNEIVSDVTKEQEERRLRSVKRLPGSGDPVNGEQSGSQPVAVAATEITAGQREEESIKAAEKEKRRAAVRKMLREIQQNPAGELFE
ncbi:MAG: SEL1-like repeat protein [Gammaproteobacteria bacterium]|nr:SEL1-like repeat protein [Gammaproteobacteria bacterium]MDH5511619.1 SEL1-like repeat protein [Gammaproteobacteria bacterium]